MSHPSIRALLIVWRIWTSNKKLRINESGSIYVDEAPRLRRHENPIMSFSPRNWGLVLAGRTGGARMNPTWAAQTCSNEVVYYRHTLGAIARWLRSSIRDHWAGSLVEPTKSIPFPASGTDLPARRRTWNPQEYTSIELIFCSLWYWLFALVHQAQPIGPVKHLSGRIYNKHNDLLLKPYVRIQILTVLNRSATFQKVQGFWRTHSSRLRQQIQRDDRKWLGFGDPEK